MSPQPTLTESTAARPSQDAQTSSPQTEGYRALLQNRNFLALWVGQVFSQLADRIVFVVFISLIVQHFGTSDRFTSFLYIAFTIPAILLTAIAGVFVDRWPRRAVLVSTNLLRALILVLLPWAAQASNGWALYGMAFLISAATQFFVPAEAATIPMIVRKSGLLSANSLFTTTMMASVIFGFALGDPLINIFQLTHVHWAIAALFALASVSLMFVRPAPACTLENGHQPESSTLQGAFQRFIAEIQDGLAYIGEHALVRNAMLKLALLFSAIVALCILFISFAKAFLFPDPLVAARKFAYIIACSGVGMALGACWVGHAFRTARRGPMVFGGFTAIGLALVLLTLVGFISTRDLVLDFPPVTLGFIYLDEVHFTLRMLYTYALAVIMGMGAAFVAIPLQSLLHELIPEDKRGKVMGVQFTILSTSSTLPVLIAGLAVEHWGVQTLFLMIGVPILAFGLVGLYQRLRSGHHDVAAANW